MYRTKDGYVSICAPTEALAHSLFHAIGRPELTTDPRFSKRDDRVVNVSELDAIVEGFTCSRTNDAVRDPRVVSRGETVPLIHPKYGKVEDVYGMGMPIKFSGAQAGFDQPPPGLGEHNQARGV